MNFKNLKEFKVPSPTYAEQTAIADVLACWDRAIRLNEQKIEKKRNIKKGLMQKLLSGETRLPGFKDKWTRVRLENICSMKSGESITSKSISEKGDFPCYGGNGLRGFTTTFTHNGEFVLIGRQGALCGNVHFVSGKFYASEHAIVSIPFESINTQWLAEALAAKNLNRHTESSAQPGLSVVKVLKMKIDVPPLCEQQAIAKVLAAADAEISGCERKLSILRNQKKYLLAKLITGAIRLPQFRKAS